MERKAKEYFFKVKENVAYVQPAVHRPGKHKETEIDWEICIPVECFFKV